MNTKWLKSIPIKSGVILGVSKKGEWFLEVHGQMLECSVRKSYWPAFALLERPVQDVYQEALGAGENKVVIEKNAIAIILVEIAKAAVEEGREYWQERAFEWYKAFPVELRREFRDSFIHIVENKIGSQSFRHKTMKELRKICPQEEYRLQFNNKLCNRRNDAELDRND